MIKNQWYGVLHSAELTNKPLGVKRLGEQLVFYREQNGNPVCLSDYCCHRKAKLSLGKVIDHKIQCPFHGLLFDKSGKCTEIPANGKTAPVPKTFGVKVYPCQEKYGWIFIYFCDEVPQELPEIPYFEDLNVNFSQKTFSVHWNTFYTRAIENQLDVAHVPFVHYNTIGRGNATTCDGPGVLLYPDNKGMNIYFYNHKEDGTLAKKPNEVPVPDPIKNFKLELLMPNLWQNYISKKIRIVAVFAPIDNENTLIYFRTYQNIITIPILRSLFNWVLKIYSYKIQKQDQRIVETQYPKIPQHQDERLFFADKPIVEFRRIYSELSK